MSQQQQPPGGHSKVMPDQTQRRRINKVILGGFGAAMALIVVIVVVGAVVGDSGGQTGSEPLPAATPQPPMPAQADQTGRPSADPRCAPASQSVVELVESGLTQAGTRLENVVVITSGTTFVAASILGQDESMVQRANAWVLHDGTVYAASSGARRHTMWPKSAAIGIGSTDDDVEAVIACVLRTSYER